VTELTPSLQHLGDALLRATAADLRRAEAPTRVRRRRMVAALAVAVIAIPSAAVAANALLSPSQVAQSIPQGTLALLDTHPTCVTLTAGVEYDCTLRSVPSDQGGPMRGQWIGTVEPTVDATKHVNGGCRSVNAAGTHWRCYIGQAAVDQKIIGAGLLGGYAPKPGVG
jgi:hypothetical protein